MRKKGKILIKLAMIILPIFAFVIFSSNVKADSTREQGVDISGSYQGSTAVFGQASDRFAIIQIGGYYSNSATPFHIQNYYQSQVASTIAQGKRAHTYIFSRFETIAEAKQMLDYYLPRVQTPKNSIVMLDVEPSSSTDTSFKPTTEAIVYALNRISAAGYTAVLYGSRNFLKFNIDLQTISNSDPLALAAYPNYKLTKVPNYSIFPSFNNIAIYQFTSTYLSSGLDGDVDLTGITKNGYNGTTTNDVGATEVKTDSTTIATKQGQTANSVNKYETNLTGYTVKVNFSASKWATGQSIPNWVKGQSYVVQEGSSDTLLLGGILSKISRSDVEILQTKSQTTSTASKTTISVKNASSSYSVKSGDNLSSIAAKFGTTWTKLASLNNIKYPYTIYIGENIKVSGTATISTSSSKYYVVRSGDNLSSIAAKYGTTWTKLKSLNGLSNANYLYVGQKIKIN